MLISFVLKVDKHIRKLDADLARFESDLKEQHAKEAGFSDYESKISFLVFDHLTEVILNDLLTIQYSLFIHVVQHNVLVITSNCKFLTKVVQ